MELGSTSEDAMVRGAVSHLAERLATVDEERIESTVRRYVEQRCANARVTTFVGILAERGARNELERDRRA